MRGQEMINYLKCATCMFTTVHVHVCCHSPCACMLPQSMCMYVATVHVHLCSHSSCACYVHWVHICLCLVSASQCLGTVHKIIKHSVVFVCECEVCMCVQPQQMFIYIHTSPWASILMHTGRSSALYFVSSLLLSHTENTIPQVPIDIGC